jgi:hypothetical protein
MDTQAKRFCEVMSSPKALASAEISRQLASTFDYKIVRFIEHDNKKGMRFADGSKVFFGDEGKLILPVEA